MKQYIGESGDCKSNSFESCLKVCSSAKERIENCIDMCLVGVKELCGDKTKLNVRFDNFSTSVETESKSKGWVLVFGFVILLVLILIKMLM